MEVITDRTITGEDVRLDEHTFVSCRLNDCRIIYGGGHFGLFDTHMNNPSWAFDGAAQRTINLLLELNFDLSQMRLPPPAEEISN